MAEYPQIPISYGARVRPSPFFESTLEHGVTALSVYNHMLMPLSYQGVEADYRSLIEGVTIWDVGGERQVEITGPDAAEFTQYLVTRDITKLAPGRARYALVCQEDGGVLNDAVLLRLAENHFWLSLADSDILLWAKGVAHGSRFDVNICEPDVSPLQVQGPQAADLMRPLFGSVVDEMGFFHFVETDLDGIPVVVSRTGWSGEFGYEIFLRDGAQGGRLWQKLFDAGRGLGVKAGAPNNIRRMEAGLLSYRTDMDATMNPIELGLDRFVDLAGPDDFIGKQAIAHVVETGPRRLKTGLFISGEPIRQGPIRWWPVSVDGRSVGVVTSATWSPTLEQNMGFSVLDVDFASKGLEVTVATPDGTRTAITTAIPFVDPRY